MTAEKGTHRVLGGHGGEALIPVLVWVREGFLEEATSQLGMKEKV